MQIGDIVRCNVTKDPSTIGVVVAIVKEPKSLFSDRIEVLTSGNIQHWGSQRLEVIIEAG